MIQNDQVLAYMDFYGSITAKEAIENIAVSRLAARIADIRAMGIPIIGEWETGLNRYGIRVRYKRYRRGQDESM